MKQRPIIFSAPMVQAILAGRKTQTRRIVKPQPTLITDAGKHSQYNYRGGIYSLDMYRNSKIIEKCPYGEIGDQLWVKETTIRAEDHGYLEPIYVASEDGRAVLDTGLRPAPDDYADVEPHDIKLRPSIFMPKKFARIWLEITDIRVERLQDISEADAVAEGSSKSHPSIDKVSQTFGFADWPRSWFAQTWDHINGADSWAVNPWVWVVEFKVVQGGDL